MSRKLLRLAVGAYKRAATTAPFGSDLSDVEWVDKSYNTAAKDVDNKATAR